MPVGDDLSERPRECKKCQRRIKLDNLVHKICYKATKSVIFSFKIKTNNSSIKKKTENSGFGCFIPEVTKNSKKNSIFSNWY